MRKKLLLLSILSILSIPKVPAQQTNTPATLAALQQSAGPTPPAPAPGGPSITLPADAPAPLALLANLLPAWDATATNTFTAKEFELGVAPLWKSQTASGATPYLDVSGTYYLTKNWGVQGALTTLGDGGGSSSLDSGALRGIFRKDVGNLAGYAFAGPARDFHNGKFAGDVGLGIEYRYRTHVNLFADTAYRYEGGGGQSGFLTRLGLSFVF